MMIKRGNLLLLLFLSSHFNIFSQSKLRRSESFFGFHFDFHATADDKEIGKYIDAAAIGTFIEKTKPDYIQIDSKGHPGYSSYPTRIGYAPDNFVQDPLKLWREATNRYNLPLYVHYSGIWDDKAIHENPSWGRMNADGSRDPSKAALLGDYPSKLMIPQIKEMIDRYHIDGIWVDGDCWSTGVDYSPEVVNGFKQATGLKEAPLLAADAGYQLWQDYNRLIYRNYVRNYVDELHRHSPDFQVASNWAYSSMMPEPVDVNVDFLSGDVSGQNCVYSAAFQSRCLALQGKPWDLMAWGFVAMNFSNGIHSPKSLVQLQQEAAEVMAMGGGFQVYFQQNRDASLQNTIDVDAMAALASFCRERQPFCQGSKIIPQIGMWYSVEGWKKHNAGVYGWPSGMEGINNLLLDGQHAVEILMDHHLREKMEQYRVIVIPEWDAFDETLKQRLLNYVSAGGNLLVIGAKAVKQFEPQLGVTFEGTDRDAQFNIGDRDLGGVTGIHSNWQPAITREGTKPVGHIYHQRDYRFQTKYAAASITSYGKGKIAGIYMDLAKPYGSSRHPVYNRIIDSLLHQLDPEAMLRISGSDKIHSTLAVKNSDILINLINADGAHFNTNVLSYNTIAASGPLVVSLRVDQKPQRVTLQPANKKLKYTYNSHKGAIEIQVPPVVVHSIVQVSGLLK